MTKSVQPGAPAVQAESQEGTYNRQRAVESISHEMRTTLNTIAGYLAALQEGVSLSKTQREYFRKAQKASEHLDEQVAKMLDLFRIDNGELVLNESWFRLDTVVLRSLESVSEQAERKKLSLVFNSEFSPRRLRGDSRKLQRILTELLENAIKFTEEGTVRFDLEMSTVKQKKRIVFVVEDTGPGLSAEQKANLFEPYVRHTSSERGLGIGLYLVRQFLLQMDGSIFVDSREGEGTRIETVLEFEEEEENTLDLEGKLICFYDDKKGLAYQRNRTVMVRYMRESGAQTIRFEDENAFALYLLDSANRVPDIINVTTYQQAYGRFDALVGYLKRQPRFAHTGFIAEYTSTRQPTEHFDRHYERFAELSVYTELLEQKAEAVCSGRSLRILVVDDLASNLEILRLFIHQKYPDAVVDAALGGYEAIGMYKTQQYDLLLLDLKMPGLSGYELLERLQEIAALPKAYAITGDIYSDTYEKVEASAFNGLLEKPVNPDKLYEVMKEVADA